MVNPKRSDDSKESMKRQETSSRGWEVEVKDFLGQKKQSDPAAFVDAFREGDVLGSKLTWAKDYYCFFLKPETLCLNIF